MAYDDDDAEMNDLWIFDSQGRAVAYREEAFFVYQIDGNRFGTHGYKRNTAFRTNEIFRGGRYVGEIRGDRLFYKEAKADMVHTGLFPNRMSRLPVLRPRLKAVGHPVPLPPGCRDVEFD